MVDPPMMDPPTSTDVPLTTDQLRSSAPTRAGKALLQQFCAGAVTTISGMVISYLLFVEETTSSVGS